jgi:hypothetical protein
VNAGKAASNSPREPLSEGEIAESQKTAHIANIRPTRTEICADLHGLFWPPLFAIRNETLLPIKYRSLTLSFSPRETGTFQ